MLFRARNLLAAIATCAVACSSASPAPAPYVPPAGDRVTEQENGTCPQQSTLLRGTAQTGAACTEGADCAPICCQCSNGTNRAWLAVHCNAGICVGAPTVCADTSDPATFAKNCPTP